MMMMQDNMIFKVFWDFLISLSTDFLLSIADDTPALKAAPNTTPATFFICITADANAALNSDATSFQVQRNVRRMQGPPRTQGLSQRKCK